MGVRKLRSGHVPAVTASQYVGIQGTIFWDDSTGALRLSDGATAGGSPLPINIASQTEFGGVKLGPGVTTNSEGQIIIDPEGLSFSFGDFASTVGTYAVGHPKAGDDYALLSSVNAEEDIIIASNGATGVVKVIGDFSVRHTNGDFDSVLADEPIFRISADGQIQMLVPLADTLAGALEIIGNDAGTMFPPNQTGVLLHVTGNQGLANRNYFDADDNYVLLAGRRYNGTAEAPTAVLQDQIMMRLVGQGVTSDGTFKSFGPVRISFIANEDQTPTAQGGRIAFEVTKNGFAADGTGTNTVTVMTLDAQTGVTSTVGFVGNLTGNASGTAGSVAAANITGTTLASNVVTSSLTSVGTLGSLAVTGQTTLGSFTGKYVRTVRDAGTIADGGTVTINFATDAIVHFVWGNGVNLAYSNYTAGRVVKVFATKTAGTGNDTLSLDGLTAANVSTGATTLTGAQATTQFVELTCTGTTIGSVYAKL